MTKARPLPPQKTLLEDFIYNQETGDLVRCDGLGECLNGKGYWRISMWGEDYLSHRIIWKMMTGGEADQIDHINGDGLDNRWCNLRNVDNKTNGRNQKKHKTNTSGYTGVRLDRTKTNWHAFIRKNAKHIHIGTFRCPTAAFIGRQQYLKEYEPNLFSERHGK